MRSPLVIVGAGGLAREVARVVEAVNAERPRWELLGFLDDDPRLHGGAVDGIPVLGPSTLVHDLPEVYVVACVARSADPGVRGRVTARLALPEQRYATLVHPTAALGSDVTVGPGSVLLAGVVATAAVRIGRHVAVMPRVVLTHDDRLGDHVTVAAGACLAGGVTVGAGAYLGSGCLVREHLSIGAGAVVGMGAVVLRDVPAGETWAGNPARRLPTRPRHRTIPEPSMENA